MNIYRISSGLLVILAAATSSCATYREQVWRKNYDPAQVRTRQWAVACEPYAMMSCLAYFSSNEETGVKQIEVDDLRKNEFEEIKNHERHLTKTGWKLLGNCEPAKGENGYGLYFDVWENRQVVPREVVFAFRGTQFSEMNDWIANMRWFRWANHVRKDQYATAREDCLLILGEVLSDREAKKAKVITTGHSLGAGLAQTVLYQSVPWVDQAIVFDPSPVSGFLDLDKNLQKQYLSLPFHDKFSGCRVVRVYAKGEILQYVRNVTQLFYRPHPLTYSVEFKTGGAKGLISKHSMLELTKSICESAEKPVVESIPQTLPKEKPKVFKRFNLHLEQIPQTAESSVTKKRVSHDDVTPPR